MNTIAPRLAMTTVHAVPHLSRAQPGVAAVYGLVVAVAAGFALIVIGTILVIIGVHKEERDKSILRGHRPPTTCALLARWVLGAHFYLLPEERPDWDEGPEEEPPWFERSPPPNRPIGPRGR